MEISFEYPPIEHLQQEIKEKESAISFDIGSKVIYPCITGVELARIASIALMVISLIGATIGTLLTIQSIPMLAMFLPLSGFAGFTGGLFLLQRIEQITDLDSPKIQNVLRARFALLSFSEMMEELYQKQIALENVTYYRLLGNTPASEYATYAVIGKVYQDALKVQDQMSLETRRCFDQSIFTYLQLSFDQIIEQKRGGNYELCND